MISTIRMDQLKGALKAALKTKGLTYTDVARELGCSIPTIKRILGPEDLTVARLLEICEIVDLSLTDLEQLATLGDKSDKPEFTDTQEEFFSKNLSYLAYLSALWSGDSPDAIAKEYNLTKRSTDLYLVRLEKIGLISVDSKKRVRIKFKQFPNWQKDGRLMKSHVLETLRKVSNVFESKISRRIAETDGNRTDQQPTSISVGSYQVSKEVYDRWAERIAVFQTEVRRESEFEERHRKTATTPTVLLSIMHTLYPANDPQLKQMQTILGGIPNL